MSLLENLRKRKLTPDFEWQISQFEVAWSVFQEFRNRNEAAEVLALWMQRFKNLKLTCAQRDELNKIRFVATLDDLLRLITDRWVSGDPSFKLLLKKSLQSILLIRNDLVGLDAGFTTFIKHAASYAQGDIRIAYGVLEVTARTDKVYNGIILDVLEDSFIMKSLNVLAVDESRSGIIGRCLAAILGPLGPQVWFENTRELISEPSTYQTVMTYFIEPVLKQSRESQLGFAKFYDLCKPLHNPSIEIGILKAGKNAKIDVSQQIRSSHMIAQSLSSLSRNLRYDALSLLCNSTHKLSEPIPSVVFDLIIENSSSLLAEGEPRSRADVYSAFRSLLIRVNVSKSHERSAKFVEFIARWCATSLCPGMPYRCLSMAGRLLELFVELEVPILDEKFAWHKNLMTSLVNCVVSDFNDIREMAVNMLARSTHLDFLDANFDELTKEAFKLMASSRNGESGARLWQFLHSRNPVAKLADRVVFELQSRLTIAESNLMDAVSTTRVHGFITSLRLTPPTDKSAVVSLVRHACAICTPPLTAIAPEGASEDLINYCWKAIKESSLLLEEYANSGMLGDINHSDLLHQLAYMLTDITHWGAFSAVPPAFVAVAKKIPEVTSQIAWRKITDLSSGSDSRSVTRRSAGLPMLITSCLQVDFDEKIVDALFELANLPFHPADNEAEDLEMSQVHGMNCIRAVITAAELSKQSARYLSRAFEQCLKMFNSPSWSLRNCAAMLFSSLFKRLFGVRGLPIAAPVFFQKYKNLKGLLVENLAGVTRDSELHAVFPALAILGKLKPVGTEDVKLADFWSPLVELLGSKSWKIRELAAQAIKSITHPDELVNVVAQFCVHLNVKNQNELHGFGLAIYELLCVIPASAISASQLSLSSFHTHMEKIISHNKCMETNTILYRCYARMGGGKRVISFQDLPKYEHLNRSLATFEAEQVRSTSKIDTQATNLLNGWAPVLEILPAAQWNLELARSVLDRRNGLLPEIRKACLRILERADHIPWANRSEVAFPLLASDQPPSIREAAAVLISHHVSDSMYEDWSQVVSDFSQDEAPAASRRSALKSLETYLDRHSYADRQLSALLRLITDEEDDIREYACIIVSKQFKLRPTAPGKCAEVIVQHTSGDFLAKSLTENLVKKAQLARAAHDNANDAMFVVEKESSYKDELRNACLQIQFSKVGDAAREKAKQASVFLAGLEFDTPLKASASTDLLTIKAIVDAFVH